MELDRALHSTMKYHYKIVNIISGEVLAESDYYDYLAILLTDLKEIHKGICDPDTIVIVKGVVDK